MPPRLPWREAPRGPIQRRMEFAQPPPCRLHLDCVGKLSTPHDNINLKRAGWHSGRTSLLFKKKKKKLKTTKKQQQQKKNGNQFPSPRSCIVQRTHPSLLKVSSSDQSLTRTQCLSCTATTVAFPYLIVSERTFPVFALIGSSVNSDDPSLCRRPL